MAKSGMFRSSLHGFHRQDVLDYINALQSSQAEHEVVISRTLDQYKENEDRLQEQISLLNAALEAANARAEEAEQREKEQEQEVLALRERAENDEQTAEKLRQTLAELEALQQREKENEQTKQRLAETVSRGEELAAQGLALEQENARLRALLESIRKKTDALHVYGQNFVAASYKCSEDRLAELDAVVSYLEQQLTDARGRIGEERARLSEQIDTAGIRLQELMQTIESGEPLGATAAVAENVESTVVAEGAESTAVADPDDLDSEFFRDAADPSDE